MSPVDLLHSVLLQTTPAPMETMNKRRKKRTSYVQKGVFDMKTRSADARVCFVGFSKYSPFIVTIYTWAFLFDLPGISIDLVINLIIT